MGAFCKFLLPKTVMKMRGVEAFRSLSFPDSPGHTGELRIILAENQTFYLLMYNSAMLLEQEHDVLVLSSYRSYKVSGFPQSPFRLI